MRLGTISVVAILIPLPGSVAHIDNHKFLTQFSNRILATGHGFVIRTISIMTLKKLLKDYILGDFMAEKTLK